MLAGIMIIQWSGPKLTPQEAADILRPHQTAIVVPVSEERPRFIVITKPAPEAPKPQVVFRPLNCCSVYRITRHGVFVR
jgi:hypothetical protein